MINSILIQVIKDRVKGKPKAKRSSQWPKVRQEYLKNNPKCAVCGGTKKCEVHHVLPFHLFPELELDLKNLITLCECKKYGVNCHLFMGHLGNYKKFNYNIDEDAIIWNKRLKEKI
ncbi:MAG: HNH endonuclease [Candidatus Marinimicrobia bacterium]|nr:HNH endonuclease [Candidatus Neomarinimicrobiota bacterium]